MIFPDAIYAATVDEDPKMMRNHGYSEMEIKASLLDRELEILFENHLELTKFLLRISRPPAIVYG